jgi:amidohydrolase
MNDNNYELAVKLRHELHRHPEVSNNEIWTKAYLMDFLRNHTCLEVVDRGAWFYAVYRASAGAKKIAFRADFDALPIDETITLPYGSQIPGVSHKCGHDGHSASLAALALEVDKFGCENNIYFIFQHAEETGDGAKQCVALIEEEGIDEVFGYHNEPGYPLGEVIVNSGSFQCASKGMSLYFKGVSSHASDPGVGRNPAPAIARIICALPSLYRAEDYNGLVLCTVIHVEIGSPTFGTSASSGVLRVTLRGQYEEEMNRLQARLDMLAFGLASEYGLDYHTEFCDYFPESVNHPSSVEKIRKVCAKLRIKTHEFPHPKRGSEDFGYFTKATLGAYFNIGAGNITPHHTVTFDFQDDIIKTAVDVFYELACKKEK